MPHHTVLELKRHWGTAELQEVWKKTEGRQDEERSDVGNERGGGRRHTKTVISHIHLHILSETSWSKAGFKNSGSSRLKAEVMRSDPSSSITARCSERKQGQRY